MVKALSLDGPVQADGGLLDGLLVPVLTTTVRPTLGLPALAPSSSLTANGIGVALIDSGITPSSNFNGRIGGFYDFTNGHGGLSVTPYDDYGHGTHIAGLIASKGVISNDFQGIAPSAKLIGLKVLD
jgi:serine protease AprX